MRVKASLGGHHPARNFELFERYESRTPAQYIASVVSGKQGDFMQLIVDF
jgi:hypothetical protein